MKWIGLTGGIATGKSAAKKLIEGLGYPCIDADELARLVVQPDHQGYQQVIKQFGASILNSDERKSLNRSALADIIFSDPAQRLALEAILHPLIQKEVQILKNKYAAEKQALCFYDVPLLFEKKLASQFDCTILVWCDEATQKVRLMQRNHLSESQALLRIQSQLRLAEKLPQASYCIDNSTDLGSLGLQIKHLISKLI
jgi:dephospho-CoA kinase